MSQAKRLDDGVAAAFATDPVSLVSCLALGDEQAWLVDFQDDRSYYLYMPKPNAREQLMTAGLHTLHTHGFNGCAVQDITQAAGVPKGSFYNHFESKEALALAALDIFWEKGAARRTMLSDATVAPVERLRAYFRSIAAAANRANYERGCLVGNFSAEMTGNLVFRERLIQIYADWSADIGRCIEEARAAGQLNTTLPTQALAAFLINAWEGAVLRTKVEKNGSAFENFDQVVFAGLFT